MKYNLKIGLLRVVLNQSFRQNSERVERAIVIVVILAEHLNLKIKNLRENRVDSIWPSSPNQMAC